MFLSIGIKAQSYDDSNVHYYLPVGFSVENIYKNEPPSCIDDVYTYNYGGNAFWGSGPYTSHIAVKKIKKN